MGKKDNGPGPGKENNRVNALNEKRKSLILDMMANGNKTGNRSNRNGTEPDKIRFTDEELCAMQYAVKLIMPDTVRKMEITEKIKRHFENLGDRVFLEDLRLIENIPEAWEKDLESARVFYWREPKK